MIKVIGENPDIVKKVTCSNCSSILEYLPVDVIESIHTDYSGCKDLYKFINCPACSKDVNVN